MRKLLHERLRGYADHFNTLNYIQEQKGVIHTKELIEKLADEIERYYIPRPRFEDGEPVPWNSADIEWESRIKIWGFNAIRENGMPMAFDGDESICAKAKMTDDGFVVRKQPKVYGADGVQITLGESVLSKGGAEYIVVSIEDVDHIHLRRPFEGDALVMMPARCLTHKEPDSQSKIDDDATLQPNEYCKKHQIEVNPNPGFDMSSYIEAMCKHLLQRQREIMKRGA